MAKHYSVNCPIEGVIIRELPRHSDQRGWLQELFRQDELESQEHPVMAYVSLTHPGKSRGPHEHREQSDCFGFVGPSDFHLYLWDNRRDSATFGNKCVLEVGDKFNAMVVVPPGVVHGYVNVGKVEGLVFNSPNRLYAGKGRSEVVDEIRYEERPDAPFAFEE